MSDGRGASALQQPQPEPALQRLRAMTASDLDAVMAIETRAYDFPWSRGNFADSINAGNVAQVLADADGALLGYFIAMPGVEEMHLLNLAVEPLLQGRGLGAVLLDAVLLAALRYGARVLWLEVRPSNPRAGALYARFGLHPVARRRDYYPALDASGNRCREDAIVMSAAVDALCRRRGVG